LAMPFLCLASAYLINRYWHTKAGKIVTVVYFASVVIMFIVFYPVISGMPVSTSWIYKLKWLSGWFFAP
jgi:dolichyl-phosphate-mannose--protein O-mannosyl transferase